MALLGKVGVICLIFMPFTLLPNGGMVLYRDIRSISCFLPFLKYPVAPNAPGSDPGLQDLMVIMRVTQRDVMILHTAETEEGSCVGRGLDGNGTLFP